MEATARALYLDLLKKALSFALWPEPPIPLSELDPPRSRVRGLAVSIVGRAARTLRLELVRPQSVNAEDRSLGRIWPGCADTMIGLRRLDNLQECIETVIDEKTPGDLIETGVWRGGACILMRAVLAAHGERSRKVFVADSFEGLPPPDPEQWPADRGDRHHTYRRLAVSEEAVKANFRRYGLLDDQVVFLKGWFKDTLRQAPIQRLAVLRLDGDMYGSTMDALVHLYPKLSPGGFCIVDDYALPGCRQAVDDYRAKFKIEAEMRAIDWTGSYWKKR